MFSIVNFEAITPNDGATALDRYASYDAIYVEASGDISVLMVDQETPIVLPAVMPGVWLYMKVRKVYSTNTTATGIKGGWTR